MVNPFDKKCWNLGEHHELKRMIDHPQLNKHRAPRRTRMEVQRLTLKKNYNVLKINISHLLKINNGLNTSLWQMQNENRRRVDYINERESVSLNKALQLGDRTFCCYLEVDNAFTNLRLTLSMLASCLRKFTLRTKRPENRNEMEKHKSNK